MKISLDQYERIMKFLDGEMTLEEMHDFERGLAANPEMQKQIDFEQLVRDVLKVNDRENKNEFYGEENIQTKFPPETYYQIEKAKQQWREQKKIEPPTFLTTNQQPQKSKIIFFHSWLKIAAACVLILTAAGIIWFITNRRTVSSTVNNTQTVHSSKKDSQPGIVFSKTEDSLNLKKLQETHPNLVSLYNQYFKKDAAPDVKPMLLAEALTNYENNNYKLLQHLDLTNLPNGRSDQDDLTINSNQTIKELGHYYKGLAFIETKDDMNAIANLQWVVDSAQNKQLQVKAKWYISLIQLKKGNTGKAIALLTSISDNGISRYSTYAKELLHLLKPTGKQ